MRFTTSLMKIDEQNLNEISNNMKVSQLMRFSMNVMKVETEAKIDEPFEEYVKILNVRPVDDTSAEVEKVINIEAYVCMAVWSA